MRLINADRLMHLSDADDSDIEATVATAIRSLRSWCILQNQLKEIRHDCNTPSPIVRLNTIQALVDHIVEFVETGDEK